MAAGTLTVRIIGDTAPLKKALGDADQSVSGFGSKMQAVGGKMQSFGKKATIGMTLPLVAVGKVAFDAASDLEESMSKVNVVFGKNAKEVQKWSKNSAKAFGQSRQSALEAAGTYGNLFQAFGIGREESTKMSKSLVELAADLASFNNTSVDDALIALRSGLSGETEPLKRFGIAINDARLKEEALRLGLIKTTKGVLPVAIKSQAAYALIMKDSALAQGDFARTADGAANKSRIMKAQFDNAAASLGRAMLPVLTQVIGFVGRLAEKFNGLSPTMQKVIVIGAAVLAALGPVVGIIGTLISVVGSLSRALLFLAANPVVLVIAGLAALGIALVVAYNRSETFRNAVNKVAGLFKQNWGVILAPLTGGLSLLVQHFDKVIGIVKTLLEWIRKIPGAIDKALGPIDEILGKAAKVTGAAKNVAGGALGGKIGGALDSVLPGKGLIPRFDNGGVMPGPRGKHALAYVAGGETISATHKQPMAGTSVTMENHFHGNEVPTETLLELASRQLGWRLGLAGGT